MRAGGLLAAVTLVTATAGVAAAGTLLPAGAGGTGVSGTGLSPRAVQVAAPTTLLGCPGPPVLAGEGEGGAAPKTDAQFRAAPVKTASTTWVLAPAETATGVSVGALAADASSAGGPGQPVAVTESVAAGAWKDAGALGLTAHPVVSSPSSKAPANLGALSAALTTAGDLRGLSATSCAAPSVESWLVGGGTDIGHSARLVLDNPGTTTATVDVEVLTGTGTQAPTSGRGVVVPPGQRRELLVEGLAPSQPEIALHVSSTGGRVSAFVLESSLRGLVPGGVDVVAPGAAPSARQVVPGVLVGEGTRSSLRLAVPGAHPAVMTWRLFGADGEVAVEGESVATVPAGSVLDVELAGLEPGVYTAVVESQSPVLAAARVLRGTVGIDGVDLAQPTDVAWAAAVEALGELDAVVTLPASRGPKATPTLVLTGFLQNTRVAVRVVDADGRVGPSRSVELAAGSTLTLTGDDLAPAGSLGLLVRAEGDGVAASLVLTAGEGDELLSVVPVHPGPGPEPDVVVGGAAAGAWP